jgi:archaellum component FlaC
MNSLNKQSQESILKLRRIKETINDLKDRNMELKKSNNLLKDKLFDLITSYNLDDILCLINLSNKTKDLLRTNINDLKIYCEFHYPYKKINIDQYQFIFL